VWILKMLFRSDYEQFRADLRQKREDKARQQA
jgi:hypothetical protein